MKRILENEWFKEKHKGQKILERQINNSSALGIK